MNKYELLYIIASDVAEEERNNLIEKLLKKKTNL